MRQRPALDPRTSICGGRQKKPAPERCRANRNGRRRLLADALRSECPCEPGIEVISYFPLTCLVEPAPGPAPKSAPVVGFLSVRDSVRDAAFFAGSASCEDDVTSASPSPPSTGACCSGSPTNSQSFPHSRALAH